MVLSEPLVGKRPAGETFSFESESGLRFNGTEEKGVRWVRSEKKVGELDSDGLWW